MKLHISNGNAKMGAIPNLSFPPGITCRKDAPCLKDGCYALKFYRMYPRCKTAWDENFLYYKSDFKGFWNDLDLIFKTTRYFRYFVSGDIPDKRFFKKMLAEAEANPDTKFLCFTKQFEIVNEVIGDMPMEWKFPTNLHLLFSGWEGLEIDNPYGFPTTEVYNDGQEIPDEWLLCGGNCSECVCRGVGCWQVVSGEVIAFKKH